MSIKISKARITKDNTLKVSYEMENAQGTWNLFEMEGAPTIHPDLRAAFDNLVPHFALLTDQKEADLFKNPNKVDMGKLVKLEVSGFSLSDGDSPGVTISGNRKIGTGKQINFPTPFTKYDDEVDVYDYSSDLQAAIDQCCEEVKLYIVHEKYAEKQPDLIDGSVDATVTVEAGGEKRTFKKKITKHVSQEEAA